MFTNHIAGKTNSVKFGRVPFFLLVLVLLAACSMPGGKVLSHYSNFPLSGEKYLDALAAGPDGNIWFMIPAWTPGEQKIGKMTPNGVITRYYLPTYNNYLQGITAGPDGNVWFTEYEGNKIGRITPSGTITEYPLPASGRSPRMIVPGSDGNLWFTEPGKVGKVTTAGVVTEFPAANNLDAYGIAAGPDSNLWVTGYNNNMIARVTPRGEMTIFSIPTTGSGPMFITNGPDGNLWFSESIANKIGRITPQGMITEFPLGDNPNPLGPWGITAGPDGNLWIIEESSIIRMTPTGTTTTFAKPAEDLFTIGYGGYITTGPDGNIWFAEVVPGSTPRLIRFSPNQ